jgi:pepF/M3 family oligoendopeptidase
MTVLKDRVGAALDELNDRFHSLAPLNGDTSVDDSWSEALRSLEQLDDEIAEIWCYAECAASADVEDDEAKALLARLSDYLSVRGQLDVPIWSTLAAATSDGFARLIGSDELAHMRLYLEEQRDKAASSMEPELEALHEALARDGLHSWGRLYDVVSGSLTATIDRGEGLEVLSMQQARNLLDSQDADLREHVAASLDAAWSSRKETFAAALNHINGYRHVLYGRRGIDELEIPCRLNRISREALDAMFGAIEDFRPVMARYLHAKAAKLGLPKLRWYDVGVPLGRQGEKISYDEAQGFIVEHFEAFSSDLGSFARMAFRNQWIEAEDRSGKRHGGFCTTFPLNQQSRIFMTYGNTPSSVQTLAHELGHAYHSWVLRDFKGRQRSYPSTLAETASTFAETIVREAACSAATDDDVLLGLLDQKLSDAVAFVMNIPSRYRFERAMYAERAHGELPADRFSELVHEAFDHCYAGALSEYERLFWASKLHFFLSGHPFYNFPYSVGFLFSMGLYARALEEGPETFAPKYDETLRLTGFNSVETVAREALGVDVTKRDFWQSALQIIGNDVEAFEALS